MSKEITKWLQDNPEVGMLANGKFYVVLNPGCIKFVPALGNPAIWR